MCNSGKGTEMAKNKYITNGEASVSDLRKLRKIRDILDGEKKNVFGVTTDAELEEKMSDMGLVDLQRFAISIGIPGGGDRHLLKMKIRQEFTRSLSSSYGSNVAIQSSTDNAEINNKTKEILGM